MRLRELRKQKKATQEELAKYLNVHKTTYSGYENGTREPSIDTLCKLADYFNVSLDYLVGREFTSDIGYLNEEQKNIVFVLKKLNEKNTKEVLTSSIKFLNEQ